MPMNIGDPLPGFDGATEWLNGTQEEAEAAFKESPLVVHFWAVSCGICKDKMSQLTILKEKYAAAGLTFLAVHMPRYERDTDLDGIKDSIIANGITEICAVDNKHLLKDAFKNEQGWVPVYFLFDADGKLKTRAAGEFGVGILKTSLAKMFGETATEAAA